MRLLTGHDDAVGAFVARLSPLERPIWPTGFTTFGVIRDDGALVGGIVFSGWQEEAKRIELSAAVIERHVFGPQILRSVGNYVFGQLEAFRVWARTSTENHQARIFLRGVGFTPESTEAHWYGPNKHAIQYRVTEPEWKKRWGYHRLKRAA